MQRFALIAAITLLAGCSSEPPAPVAAPDSIEQVDAAAVPEEVAAVAQATLPGFTITEAERKERDGRVYYDVEGRRADGVETELDMLQTETGWRVVEVQRDIDWAEAPAYVRDVAARAQGAFDPVRVIESTQTEDGAVIYELFAAGRPEAPSMEVRVFEGRAEVLAAANPH